MIVSARNIASEASALKWLILIGLLWAQVAYASHQLTHDVDELGETCRICTGYHHFENALSDAVCAAPMPAVSSALPALFAIPTAPERPYVYGARAPPPSPDSTI